MPKRLLLLALIVLSAAVLTAQQLAWPPTPDHLTLPLWPGAPPAAPLNQPPAQPASPAQQIPHVESVTAGPIIAGKPTVVVANVSTPTLTLYTPQGANTGAAVVVFSGGGYNIETLDYEGAEVCQWLNTIGVNCLVLKFRVPRSGYPRSMAALQDAQRAIGLIRSHAAEWHIDPARVGVLGFSAGAHLAAVLDTHFDKRVYDPIDAVDKLSCRPDFAIVLYPDGMTAAHRNFFLVPDAQAIAETPPTLIFQAEDDPSNPVENSITYFMSLKNAHVPAELHIYPVGGHGFGLRPNGFTITTWPKTAEIWLRTVKILPAQPNRSGP